MKFRLLVIVVCFAAIAITPFAGTAGSQDQDPTIRKITPWVLEQTENGKDAEFLIILADQADLRPAAVFPTKREKTRYVYRTLFEKARLTQQPLLDWLKSRNIGHRSYYLINMIWVKGGRELAVAVAARSDVERLEGNPLMKNDVPAPEAAGPAGPLAVEPNITYVRAPEVWAMGNTGQGVVVGGADTGYRWDHNALKNQYRGFDGVIADHDFNWHDSIHSNGGSCGADSTAPCDDNGHGTHTMGTAVGDDGGANQIGMAPGAKWIGCRNMDQGNGTPATYIECMEFFLAPYPVGGTPAQGDPDLAPDVTVNSWSCPPQEGCMPNTLKAAVEAQRAAGIMMVVAAGNGGSSCSSVDDPPAIYDASTTIGSFSHVSGNIAGSSSRGPVIIDGSNRMKPDISAPGVGIRSSGPGGTDSYFTISGTSMATPHVAGAAALLWSAQPALKNNVGFTEHILNTAAVDVSSTQCDVNGGPPNNVYGYGRLDIKAAVDLASPCNTSPAISKVDESFSASAAVDTVMVSAAVGCNWTAISESPGFINITSGASGSGNGAVTFSITANLDVTPRIGTLTIAGQTLTVLQGAAFVDVPTDHPFYNEIGKLSARGVTLGCSTGNYCPENTVTRDQMAAFIIRALGVFAPPTPAQQRFLDVPPQHPFYDFIEELAIRQITLGCGGGNFCPSSNVSREQMAAFLMRGLGEFNPPTPAFQRYDDVPLTNQFAPFIERLAQLQITLGCGGNNYCPLDPVTRGQMAAFLVRAFDL